MLTRKLLLGTVAGLALLPAPAHAAAPGDLDPAFNGGAFTLGIDGVVTDLVALPGGGSLALVGVWGDELVKLRDDGRLDLTWGGGDGRVDVPLAQSEGSAGDIALDAEGRILVGGERWVSGQWDAAVERLRPDGTPDDAFDGDGRAIFAFDGAGSDHVTTVAPGPGGTVVAGGSRFADSTNDFAAARLTGTGDLDDGFAGDGTRVTSALGNDEPRAMAVEADGTVTLAGRSTPVAPGAAELLSAVRLTPAGAPDTTLDGDGVWTLDVPGLTKVDQTLEAIAVDPQGRLVLAGEVALEQTRADRGSRTPDDRVFVARITRQGALDASFGGDGITLFGRRGVSATLDEVALQRDGSVVAAGAWAEGGPAEFLAVRVDASGNPDGGFGAGGAVTTPFGAATDAWANAMTIDGAGRITIAGAAAARTEDPREPRDEVPAFLRLVGGRSGAGTGAGTPTPPPVTMPAVPAPPRAVPAAPRKPRVTLGRVARKPKAFAGTARDAARVEVALVRRAGKACRALAGTKVRFLRAKCATPKWLKATGTARWSLALKGRLSPGRYEVLVRGIGRDGEPGAVVRRTFRVS